VDVHPTIEFARRSATFEFQSNLARIKLRFSVSPDPQVRKLVFTYDLEILPVLMKIDSHKELEISLDAINGAELAEWLDERIVAFVQTYVALHENQYYWRGQLVEDPVCKVQFPKFAASAKLEHKGKTLYFIDESTLSEFQKCGTEGQR
jgi:YHS domain-containing protein